MHVSKAGQLAVVGVLVAKGKSNAGIIEPPSESDPSSVDFKLVDLIPNNKQRYTYDGSLTRQDPIRRPRMPRNSAVELDGEANTELPDQIKAFDNSGFACGSTTNTARPVLPVNNRFVFFSAN